MKKLFVLLFFVCISCFSIQANEIKPVIINDYDFNKMNSFQVNNKSAVALLPNTPVELIALHDINTSSYKVGDRVNFVVNNDVVSKNGDLFIKKGSLVYGEITSIKSKGKIGKSAIINIGDLYTTAVDGSIVTSSSLVSAKPQSNVAKSVILSSLVCPLFLLLEGKDAIINKGDSYTIYTRDVNYIKIK